MYEEIYIGLGTMYEFTKNVDDKNTYLVLEGKATFEIVDQQAYDEKTSVDYVLKRDIKQINSQRLIEGQPNLTEEEINSLEEQVKDIYEKSGPEGIAMKYAADTTQVAAEIYKEAAIGNFPQKQADLMREQAIYQQEMLTKAENMAQHPEVKEIMEKCHDRAQELLSAHEYFDDRAKEALINVAMAPRMKTEINIVNFIRNDPTFSTAYNELNIAWQSYMDNNSSIKEAMDNFKAKNDTLKNELIDAMGATYAEFKDAPEAIFSKLDEANTEVELVEISGIKATMPKDLSIKEFHVSDDALQMSNLFSEITDTPISPLSVQNEIDRQTMLRQHKEKMEKLERRNEKLIEELNKIEHIIELAQYADKAPVDYLTYVLTGGLLGLAYL